MDQPLVPGGGGGGYDDNNSSQMSSSQSSSGSLLERIRAQREREAGNNDLESNNNVTTTTTTTMAMNDPTLKTATTQMNIPNYTPIANDAIAGPTTENSSGGGGGTSSFGFSSFNVLNFTGFNNGGGSNNNSNQTDASQGLLMDSQYNHPNTSSQNGYDMWEYFITFVMDIYNLFRSLPIPAQAGLVVFLLWVVWKLI